jgi:hypothetical protein
VAGLQTVPQAQDTDKDYEMTTNNRATLSLDGTWQIVFDPDNRGRRERWSDPDTFYSQATREIAVPSCWEEIEQDYEGIAWYGRTFTAPITPFSRPHRNPRQSQA